jgi:hypothetical protein
MPDARRNESELLFEEYLTAHKYTNWTHEVPVKGKRKKPDFRLEHGGSSHFFEVKEFEAPLPTPGFSTYDPYGPIREKINQATRQFREYKEYSCSVVLANPKSAFVHLGDPWAIIGAMLGNLGFQFQFGVKPDEEHRLEQVFTGGGKMVNYKRQEPQNTTVSSVIVLGTYPLRRNRIRAAIKDRQRELGRGTTLDEDLAFYEAMPESSDLRRVRVSVYDNPYARIPLHQDLFKGPYDERWSVDGEFMKRVYLGLEVARFEEVLGER